jgi:general secretion pathway protein C
VAVDALLKKYFTLVVLALVALMAYFQASGATTLLGAALGADEQMLVSPPKRPIELGNLEASVANRQPKIAEPILSRNPFDSVTGPLNAKALEGELPQPGRVDASNPLAAPACDGVRVSIITESPDPTWSIAALQGPGEPGPKIRRVGDTIGSNQVAYIGFNPTEASPSVWLTNSGSLCQSLLFRTQPAAQPTAAPAAPVAPGKGGPSGVPADIASKIQKVSETEFNVDRSVVDKILENQAELMRSARIVPEQKDGKVVGIRMFGIRPDTLLGTLGFQNGDRLETINGFNMSSPEKALEAYARLRTAPNLTVKINRRGKPTTVDFRIK